MKHNEKQNFCGKELKRVNKELLKWYECLQINLIAKKNLQTHVDIDWINEHIISLVEEKENIEYMYKLWSL